MPEQAKELRCEATLHGIIKDGLIERKCHHIRCTKGKQIVFHYFDPMTGALVDTKVLQDPAQLWKGR